MTRILVTAEAFEAITAARQPHRVNSGPDVTAQGERMIWLQPDVVDQLNALRGSGEDYSDVIIRLAKAEGELSLSDLLKAGAADAPAPSLQGFAAVADGAGMDRQSEGATSRSQFGVASPATDEGQQDRFDLQRIATETRPSEDALAAVVLELHRTIDAATSTVRDMSQKIDDAVMRASGAIRNVEDAIRASARKTPNISSALSSLFLAAGIATALFIYYSTNHYTSYLHCGDGENYVALTYTVSPQNGAIARHDEIVDGAQRRSADHFLSDCVIVDPRNWKCSTFDGRRFVETTNLVNGRYQPITADGPVSQIDGLEFYFHKYFGVDAPIRRSLQYFFKH